MRAAEVIKQTKAQTLSTILFHPITILKKLKMKEGDEEIDILYKVLIKETFTRNFYLLKHRFKNFLKKIIKWENQNPKINTLNKFKLNLMKIV